MKPKLPTVKIPSDECSISIGQVIEDGEIVEPGKAHYIHKGEWVEIMPVLTVKEVMQLSRLQQGASDSTSLGENLSELCKELSRRIIKWNWTDLMGERLQQPYNRPDVLEGLSSDELLWLVNASSNQENDDDRKKDSEPSESTSSEMALNLDQ